MRLPQNGPDFFLCQRNVLCRVGIDKNLPHEGPATQDAIPRGRIRQNDEVILVVAIGGLTLALEHTNDLHRYPVDNHALSHRIPIPIQLIHDGLSENNHLGTRALLAGVEEAPARGVPISNDLIFWCHPQDGSPPVSFSTDNLCPERTVNRRDIRRVNGFVFDLLSILGRQTAERAGALAGPAGLGGTGRYHDHVRPQVLDLLFDLGLGPFPDGDHDDDRTNPDDDSQHRQERAHLVLDDALSGYFYETKCLHDNLGQSA